VATAVALGDTLALNSFFPPPIGAFAIAEPKALVDAVADEQVGG
jgi:hypothetical protein